MGLGAGYKVVQYAENMDNFLKRRSDGKLPEISDEEAARFAGESN
jgi:hypothetical protein